MVQDIPLPNGWKLLIVEDLYYVVGGGTPSTAVLEYWNGDIPWITSADIYGLKDIRPRKQITQKGIDNSATSLVPTGSLIVVTRVSLGRVALASFPLCFSQDSQALIARGKNVLPEYALYYLSQAAQNFIYLSRGTTISGITKKQLKELPFPLPPLAEQERIVARIEELFTRLEAGTAALKRVQTGLKRYKGSVLKSACEGKLFGEKENGELPEGWQWTQLGELATNVTSGSRGWAKYYTRDGDLFLRVGNFNRLTTEIDLHEIVQVNAPDTAEGIRTRLKLKDILITITADVGMVGIVDEKIMHHRKKAYINQHVGLVRLSSSDYAMYIAYALASDPLQKQFESKQYGATKKGFNLDDLKSLRIPLPPLDEQIRIVAEVERRLSVAKEIESAVEASLARTARLRQAVLKSAFEGRL
jgi:type I restriction enzyme S subunit